MTRLLVAAWLGLVALVSSGCMSIANHAPYFCPYDSERERVYGGVRLDLKGAGVAFASVARGEASIPAAALREVAAGGLLLFVDLPLCAVADTLLLPHTLRARRNRLLKTMPPSGEPHDHATGPCN